MSSVTAIATAGLGAALTHLGASAHNVANALTPGFHRQTVSQQTQSGGGVTAVLGTALDVGVDLATDLIAGAAAVYAFKAGVQVVKAADEVIGTLIDIVV